MTARQHADLLTAIPWDRELGIRAFARRNGVTVHQVRHWLASLGLDLARRPAMTGAARMRKHRTREPLIPKAIQE